MSNIITPNNLTIQEQRQWANHRYNLRIQQIKATRRPPGWITALQVATLTITGLILALILIGGTINSLITAAIGMTEEATTTFTLTIAAGIIGIPAWIALLILPTIIHNHRIKKINTEANNMDNWAMTH